MFRCTCIWQAMLTRGVRCHHWCWGCFYMPIETSMIVGTAMKKVIYYEYKKHKYDKIVLLDKTYQDNLLVHWMHCESLYVQLQLFQRHIKAFRVLPLFHSKDHQMWCAVQYTKIKSERIPTSEGDLMNCTSMDFLFILTTERNRLSLGKSLWNPPFCPAGFCICTNMSWWAKKPMTRL